MSEYRQHGSKTSYPGAGKKGRKKQRSITKPDTDIPGFGLDMDAWMRRTTGWYGKGPRPE